MGKGHVCFSSNMHPGVQLQDPFANTAHSVDGENGVNLLFLVSLILFRDMHEEIDSRIFDPPPSFLRQEK